MAHFALLECPKLISRKIWVIEKSWNFHTVLLLLTFLCGMGRTMHFVKETFLCEFLSESINLMPYYRWQLLFSFWNSVNEYNPNFLRILAGNWLFMNLAPCSACLSNIHLLGYSLYNESRECNGLRNYWISDLYSERSFPKRKKKVFFGVQQ